MRVIAADERRPDDDADEGGADGKLNYLLFGNHFGMEEFLGF